MNKDLEQYFKPEEVGPLPDDFTGQILIIDPNLLLPNYRERKNMVMRANTGFGCSPTSMGRAVFATCLADGEQSRFQRGEFLAAYVGDINKI